MLRMLSPLVLVLGALALVAWAEDEQTSVPSVGTKAPGWRLNDHTGTARTLAEMRKESWVVLAFFPKAATPG